MPGQRRYGYRHRLERKKWAPLVAEGRVSCARCKRLIAPGEKWDLGHADHDRTLYVGPEHQSCNRATQTHGRATARTRKRRSSRNWYGT